MDNKHTALLDDPEFKPQDDTLIEPSTLGTGSQPPIVTYNVTTQQVVPPPVVQRKNPPPTVQREEPIPPPPVHHEEPIPPPPVYREEPVHHEESIPPPPVYHENPVHHIVQPPIMEFEAPPPMTNGHELRKRRTPQYAPTPEPKFDKPNPVVTKKPVKNITLVAMALLFVAIVWWGVLPLLWSTSVTELNLVHRLPYDSCFSVSVEAWKNGSMLNHDMKYLVDTLHKLIKKHDFQGLASSHVGVPVCLMTWKGHDNVFVTALNLRIIGRSKSIMRTTEQSSLCPELENIYTERNKWIVVQYNRIDDYEEMERELSGTQADIVQQIFDAQNGINICH